MKFNVRLAAFFFAVYILALIAMTPLSWLRHFFEPALQQAGVQLQRLDGSLWSGEAVLISPQVDAVQLGWQAQPLSMLMLRLPWHWQLSNPFIDLQGRLTVSPTGVRLNGVSGYIDDGAFATVAASYGSSIQGRLRLDAVAASVGWGGRLGELDGDLSWSGGPVAVPFGSQVETFQLPQMQGMLSSDEARWLGRVLALDNTALIEASLTRDGLGNLNVKRALADRLNLPVPAGRETLFEISQQVF